MATSLEYRYRARSAFEPDSLGLAVWAPSEPDVSFRGRVLDGKVMAAGLLAVSEVARSRFMLSAAQRAVIRDPVLTVDETGIEVESLSDDRTVHARLTIDRDGLEAETLRPGTVNVDFNPELRTMLACVPPADTLSLQVGPDAVDLASSQAVAQAPKVRLPSRWLRGFAEVQVATAGLPVVAELRGPAVRRALAGRPRGLAGHRDGWMKFTASGLRALAVPLDGAIWVSAPERLAALDPLARHAKSLRVYAEPGQIGPSSWVLGFAHGHLSLTLSSERTYGFSGEGGVLWSLIDPQAADDATSLAGLMAEHRWIGEREFKLLGLSRERALAGMQWLGAHGAVGHDLYRDQWYLRELPFDHSELGQDPPRLVRARELVGEQAVSLTADGRGSVLSHGRKHRVALSPAACDCEWWRKHGGMHGPCSHVLAAKIVATV